MNLMRERDRKGKRIRTWSMSRTMRFMKNKYDEIMTCSSIGKIRCNWKNPKNMDSRTRSMQKQHTQRGAHVEKYMQSKTRDSRDSRDSDSAWWKWWRLNHWICIMFFCIWGHGHSWRLRFQRKNRRQLIISQTTGTKIQNLSSFALTLDSFNSFTFQIVSGFSNPQGSLAYFQRRNSWNVFWRLLHFCSSQLSKSTTKIDQVTCPDTASLTLLMNFGSRRFSKQTFS